MTGRIIHAAKNASTSLGIPVHVIVTNNKQMITYVNSSFESFTGFTKAEVVGRKCNFLQGEDTDPQDLMDMRLAVESGRETNVVILNYTKSHSAFWNTLRIRPVFMNNCLKGFIGEIFTLPVTDAWLRARPKLCLDDALALMRIMSEVPRSVNDLVAINDSLEDDKEDHENDSASVPDQDSSSPVSISPSTSPERSNFSSNPLKLQRHVNYGNRFTTTPSPPQSPSADGDQSRGSFEFVAETLLPTIHGRFRVRAYRNAESGAEPLAMIVGDVEGKAEVLCRVHDQCQTSEVFGSLRCDCKEQLDAALARIQKEGGMVLYLPQEGRGIGLANKVAAYAAQEMGLDTVDANRHLGLPDDAREYTAVRDILDDLKISSLRLMTNNPRKISELTSLGIHIASRVSIVTPPNSDFSRAYVMAKKERMFHMIEREDLGSQTDAKAGES